MHSDWKVVLLPDKTIALSPIFKKKYMTSPAPNTIKIQSLLERKDFAKLKKDFPNVLIPKEVKCYYGHERDEEEI